MKEYRSAIKLAIVFGYTPQFEWDNPFEYIYNVDSDFIPVHQSIVDSNPDLAYCEMELIRKWLRDKMLVYVGVLPLGSLDAWTWEVEDRKSRQIQHTGRDFSKSYEQALSVALIPALRMLTVSWADMDWDHVEYVYHKDKIHKISNKTTEFMTDENNKQLLFYQDCMPATEEEYNEYQNNKAQ